ncbi:MAG TPA: tetratricopeptide repeat protein [Armatimonadota bacterium]|nr:tetratricopeptide repeat protein [Armatimonadota bacterium]
MQCKNCGTVNDANSKFCKECGRKLESPAPRQALTPDAHVRIGELIYNAYKHREAGRIQEAILACQGALALNDGSASAHALLGSLYQLKGDIPAAIREYERAVELNPRSDTDHQKLEELRGGRAAPPLSGSAKLAKELRPYLPYAAAVAGLCIVLAFGLAMIWTPAETLEKGTKQPTSTSPRAGTPQATPAQPYAQPRYPQGQAFPGYQQPYPGGVKPGERGWTPRQPSSPVSPRRAETPVPETRRPVTSPPAGGQRMPTRKQPPVIVPVIEGNEKPSASKTPAVTGTPTESAGDPEERALRLQREGRYQQAISAYRESLNRTSDPGRLYQQIALCYQRTGQHDMAVDNYNRAISSYRDQLAAGRDPAEVQRNIRSCEAGIQVSRKQAR